MAFVKSYSHSPAWSDDCYEGTGDSCDGIVNEDHSPYNGEECGCGCHNDSSLTTYAKVILYHAEMAEYR